MNDLPELLDHYFSLGVAEGKEGRDHDTKDGEAQATRDLIDQKILRLQRELEEAKEFRAILEGHLSAAIDDYNDALKALRQITSVKSEVSNERFRLFALATADAALAAAKAEETPHG